MRYIKILACVVIPAIVIYFLDSGMGSLPPLGKLMDPVHGFMANAETKSSLVDFWQEKEDKLSSAIETAKKENKDVTKLEAEKKIISETKNKLIEKYNFVK